MNPLFEHQQEINRRSVLGRAATGVGAAALATLLKEDGIAEQITAGGPSDSNSIKAAEQRFGGISSLPHDEARAAEIGDKSAQQ